VLNVDQPELVEMESTFTEMNASIVQNEESSDDDNREN
jgi:hypothetical protein